MSTRVKLNLSGCVYEFNRSILDTKPSHRLTELCNRFSAPGDGPLELTVDRISKGFDAILSYYQTGRLHIPNCICPGAFREELDYWKIDVEELADCCMFRYHAFQDDQETRRRFLTKTTPQRNLEIDAKSPTFSPKLRRLRRKIWSIVDNDERSLPAKIYFGVVFFMIMVSILTLSYSTEPALRRGLSKCEILEYMEAIGNDKVNDVRNYFGNPECAYYSVFLPSLKERDVAPTGSKHYWSRAFTKLRSLQGITDAVFTTSSSNISEGNSDSHGSDDSNSDTTGNRNNDSTGASGSVQGISEKIRIKRWSFSDVVSQVHKRSSDEQQNNASFQTGSDQPTTFSPTTPQVEQNVSNKTKVPIKKPVEMNCTAVPVNATTNVTLCNLTLVAEFDNTTDDVINITKIPLEPAENCEVLPGNSTHNSTLMCEGDPYTKDWFIRPIEKIIQLDNGTRIVIPSLTLPIPELDIIDSVVVMFFTIDTFLRLASCPSFVRYFFSLVNILDACALVACYMYFAVIGIHRQYRYMETAWVALLNYMQIFRVCRLLRVVKNVRASKVLVYSMTQNLADMALLMMMLFTCISIFACLFFFAEPRETVVSIPNAWYWAVVTMTTVGYGEITPHTGLGRLVASLCAIAGVLLLAITVPLFVNKFVNLYRYSCINESMDKQRQRTLSQRAKEGSAAPMVNNNDFDTAL